MGILDEDVARVRDATDLVALASEHLALKRVGKRMVGLCPFHAEKTPSFGINPELNLYFCLGCQASGDAITFVREVEHLDFVDAVERLASRAGITLRYDDKAIAKDRTKKQRLAEAVAAAIAFYHELLLSRPTAASPAATCARRGFDGDAARQFQLGWAPDAWDQLSVHLQRQKFARDDIVDAGLAFVNKVNKLQDQFRARLMFPIYDCARRGGGIRRPRARRRRPEVQELARDADLPEESAAVRPQLGEGRDRRAGRGRDLRGLHRRHGLRARGRTQRGRHVRHRARRRPLPDPEEPRSEGGARVRLGRRRPGRGGEVVRVGAALRDPARRSPTSRPVAIPPTSGTTTRNSCCMRSSAATPFLQFRLDRVLAGRRSRHARGAGARGRVRRGHRRASTRATSYATSTS